MLYSLIRYLLRVGDEVQTAPLASISNAALWRKLMRLMLTRKGRVFQMVLNLYAGHIYWNMRDVYQQRYDSWPHIEWRHRCAGASRAWCWRGWPNLWPWAARYRALTSIVMVYVIVRYSFGNGLEALIERSFQPSLAANCYLPGRLVLTQNIQEITGLLFALLHLTWRGIQQRLPNPLAMSLIYFLMLDDRDIARYQSLMAHQAQHGPTRITRQLPLGSKLVPPDALMDSCERLMHDTMGYRVEHRLGDIYRLRPNRTPEVCRLLRTFMVYTTLTCLGISVPIFLWIMREIALTCRQPRHLLFEYPGCNPELERAVKAGRVHPEEAGLYYHEGHALFSLFADLFLNWIIYGENTLIDSLTPGLTFMVNLDLMIYWGHVHSKAKFVMGALRDFEHSQASLQSIRRPGAQRIKLERERAWLDELVLDLQMQIQDVAKQIEQVNRLVTDEASGLLVVWFTLFGFFIYNSVNRRNGQLAMAKVVRVPLVPVVHMLPLVGLLLVALFVIIYCISLLVLRRTINKSYTLVCSLMAHDQSHHKLNFPSVLDYFIENRTSYTVFRSMRLTATFLLTTVGWSLSCYLLIARPV